MKVKIFFKMVRWNDESIEDLEKHVNEFLKEHPGATIQWLQSSGGAGSSIGAVYFSTTITAIITYYDQMGGKNE